MAARFFVTGGVTTNWSDILNWSLTSGGAGGQAVPTTSDDVTLNASSPNCVLDASARVCKTLTATAYANTITFTNTLSVSGSVTLGASMVFAGSSALILASTSTLTSNGKTIGVPLTFSGGFNFTLADNAQTSSDFTVTSGASGILGAKNITVGGGFLITASSASVSAVSTTVIMNGTGNLSSAGATYTGNLTFNTAGTITQTNNFFITSGTITYTAGTVNTSGGFDLVISGSPTLDTSGMNWYKVRHTGTGTTTLLSNLNINGTGLFNLGVSGTFTINGAFNINTTSLTTIGTSTTAGTATVVITGGTVSQSGSTLTGGIRNNLTFAGNSTFSTLAYGTGTLTYTSGTITTTGSTLNLLTSCTLNTAGIVWDNITSLAAITITNNSLLSATNSTTSTFTVSSGSSTTFAGTAGFTVSAFRLIPPSTSIVLTVGNVYTIVNTIDFVGYSGGNAQISSATPGVKATLNLTAGIVQLVAGATITDIDSSGGTQALVYRGTLSNTTNWLAFTSAGNGPGTMIDLTL